MVELITQCGDDAYDIAVTFSALANLGCAPKAELFLRPRQHRRPNAAAGDSGHVRDANAGRRVRCGAARRYRIRIAGCGAGAERSKSVPARGACALDLNQPRRALRAAGEACHRAPRLAQAHYTYGRALFACNEVAQAERAFAEAVRLAPGWPEPWIGYGLVRHRRGAIEDAKGAMQQALFHAPNHPVASAHLAEFTRLADAAEDGDRNRRRQANTPTLPRPSSWVSSVTALAPSRRRKRFSQRSVGRKRERKRRPIRAIRRRCGCSGWLAFGWANSTRRWSCWKPRLRRLRRTPRRNCITDWFCMRQAGTRRLRRYSDRARNCCRTIRRRT